MLSEEKKGYIQLIIYSLLAGSVGVLVRLVQGMDAFSITFFRAFIGVLVIFAIIAFRRKIRELKIVDYKKTFLVGAFQGISIFMYFFAILNTTIANAMFLLYTAPIFSVIFAKIFLKEKIQKKTILGVVLAMIGIIFILNPAKFSFSSSNSLGILFGLGAGLFYSAMAITAKPLTKKVSGYYLAFWQYLIISVLFAISLRGTSVNIVAGNILPLLGIGIFTCGIAFILFMKGVKRVKAQKVFVVTALEPLVGVVSAIIILSEIPTLFTGIGAILILAGVFAVMRK